MNIKRAKDEIKNTIRAYLAKDEFGEYKIPVKHQRPMFLIGPPGIGKTAIMEQVARECKVGLVAYTITHHTRQSAIGLPFIEKKLYGGQEYSVTEYTMSEIIAAIYNKMEDTGLKEGILFIDEINCVSETLAATMLQFLQEKSFGNHKIPTGWIIVAAGNPPEYNKSVREFDIVTLDRVRKIQVDEDYAVWKEYAYEQSVHGSIISYLDIKKENFYAIETTVDGVSFVTARGWEDLSKMILMYEDLKLHVNESLIYQYLQHRKIAKDFANYLDFYYKYKSDYSIEEILEGKVETGILEKLYTAPFDERLTVIGLLLDKLYEYMKEVSLKDLYMNELFEALKQLKAELLADVPRDTPDRLVEEIIEESEESFEAIKKSAHMEKRVEKSLRKVMEELHQFKKQIKENHIQDHKEAFEVIKESFGVEKEDRVQWIDRTTKALDHGFEFLETAFGDSQEMVIFITELTMNYYSSRFISDYGCDKYYQYSKELMYQDRRKNIQREIEEMNQWLQEN